MLCKRNKDGDGPCLGARDPTSKKYTWLTSNLVKFAIKVHERATFVCAGLVALGCEPSQQTYISIYGLDRVDCVSTDLGCQMFSMVSVPVYATHGAEECIFIINHSEKLISYASQCSSFGHYDVERGW
ncbi:long-chain-fatty-acid--CoA ligase 5-like [Stylophora pistillata]|uniref:long-chain-fatty-acid--CoA ligase 5-like n=1 Tax=Stylophora pistillata TaxID=50429 RepID=UPI000C055D38|nr:long-chain-fatty-acid--CoA ligase 5-like [Stylophora pistillata]